MLHSEQKYAHFCSEWSIVGYGTGAFWDLWIRSVGVNIVPASGQNRDCWLQANTNYVIYSWKFYCLLSKQCHIWSDRKQYCINHKHGKYRKEKKNSIKRSLYYLWHGQAMWYHWLVHLWKNYHFKICQYSACCRQLIYIMLPARITSV